MASIGMPAPKNEPPTGWEVLLAVVAGWGITLRTAVLVIIVAAVAVALVIYLGPVAICTLATIAAGEGARRVVARRRRS